MTNRLHIWSDTLWLTIVFSAAAFWGIAHYAHSAKGTADLPAIPPGKVTDLVHAVIQADRTVYTTHVVERMQEKGIALAHEHWEQHNALPLPAQFLNYAGRLAAEGGSGIRYGLISQWPIRNGPSTDFERQALETLAASPLTPIKGVVMSGKKKYFQAIYADRAVSKACITCHNEHLLSPKRDFKLNDVMGAIVITIPLQQ